MTSGPGAIAQHYSALGKAHIRFYRPKNVPAITGSKDLQNVNITLRILFRYVQFVTCRLYRSSDDINRTFLEIGDDDDE